MDGASFFVSKKRKKYWNSHAFYGEPRMGRTREIGLLDD